MKRTAQIILVFLFVLLVCGSFQALAQYNNNELTGEHEIPTPDQPKFPIFDDDRNKAISEAACRAKCSTWIGDRLVVKDENGGEKRSWKPLEKFERPDKDKPYDPNDPQPTPETCTVHCPAPNCDVGTCTGCYQTRDCSAYPDPDQCDCKSFIGEIQCFGYYCAQQCSEWRGDECPNRCQFET